ncbi:class I SAM-dependent methyltransferase [Streptomyces sp. ZYX-F-203]
MGVSMESAKAWVERWERQQRRYAVDREERFTVIADLVEHLCAGRTRPLLLDLGCGPGSLAARLARRMPHAEIVAVDSDPVLLELGRTHHADAARYVRTVIGEAGWTDALELRRAPDVAVSTTALHCLPVGALSETYRALGVLLPAGGALVNGDHFPPDAGSCGDLTAHVGRRRAERAGGHPEEDWLSWWRAASADPELADLFERRDRGGAPSGDGSAHLPLCRHSDLLTEAGFGELTPVWQVGDSRVVVARRL